MRRMNADTHEAVWGLGARAARESRGKFDLDGAFLAAVRKHGTKVFPASVAREDDAWFEEYFQAFRDGAKSAGMKESMTTMRQLIGQLNEVASNAEMDVAKQAISKAQALVGVAGELASRAGRNGDKKMEMAANKAADAAEKLAKEAQRWARGSAGKTVATYTVGGGRQVTVPEDDK